MNDKLLTHPDFIALHRVILRLALISHAGTQGYDFAQRRSKGSRPPTGGIDWKGDKTPEYRQKSAAYFQRRLRRVNTEEQLAALLQEARETLDAWCRTPTVAGIDPARDTFAWKCRIADDNRSPDTVARHYAVGRTTVYRYRARYRGIAGVSVRTRG